MITNNRCVAEQIKHDKVENVVMDGPKVRKCGRIEGQQNLKSVMMDGPKVGGFGKVGREQKLKSIVMDGVKSAKEDEVKHVVMGGVKTGKVGKLENCKIDEEMWCQSEEKLCKLITKGLATRNLERHAMLADVEEEQEQDVICFDDITGKELPWHAVRKARAPELKVDEKEAVAKYGITPVDSKWVDTYKAFEGEPMQIRSRMCAREFKSDDSARLVCWDSSIGSIESKNIDRNEQ